MYLIVEDDHQVKQVNHQNTLHEYIICKELENSK
jgi:hypothetical protein